MKTYNNLWAQFISKENFELAAKKAIRSKKSKKDVQRFMARRDELLQKLRDDLISGRFKTSQYQTFTIFEPKKRIIYKLPLYPDHVLHHALINVLGPIWKKMFINHSYSCIPGRGLLGASQQTMRFVKKYKYVLQCDIRKFYPSINHAIMMDIIKRKISDRRILRIVNEIVWSVGGETNLPIGNLTSQWLGNVYLNELDQFVKQVLRWRGYIRYCDDFCLYGDDKKELSDAGRKIAEFLNTKLKMSFSKCSVRRTMDGVPFIGYRHFTNFILLRKFSAYKLKRRIMNIIRFRDFGEHSKSQMAAANGWLMYCNSFNYRCQIKKIATNVSRKSGLFIKSNLFFE